MLNWSNNVENNEAYSGSEGKFAISYSVTGQKPHHKPYLIAAEENSTRKRSKKMPVEFSFAFFFQLK